MNPDSRPKDSTIFLLLASGPLLTIASVWGLFYLETILPDWTKFPLIITGVLIFIFSIILFSGGVFLIEEQGRWDRRHPPKGGT